MRSRSTRSSGKAPDDSPSSTTRFDPRDQSAMEGSQLLNGGTAEDSGRETKAPSEAQTDSGLEYQEETPGGDEAGNTGGGVAQRFVSNPADPADTTGEESAAGEHEQGDIGV